MTRRAVGATALLVALAVAALCAAPPLWAQERVVTRLAQAEVPVYQDNLDDARRRAVRAAQGKAVREALGDLVVDEWRGLFEEELREAVLERPERYIIAYRVQTLTPSLDRTRYRATVHVDVDRAQMAEDVQEARIPVRGGRTRSVQLLYSSDDPLLGEPALRQAVFDAVRDRLALLNYRVAGSDTVSSAAATVLAQPHRQSPLRSRVMSGLSERQTDTVLFVGFSVPTLPVPGAQGMPVVRAAMYQPETGEPLAAFDLQAHQPLPDLPLTAEAVRDYLQGDLLEPLLTRMQPGAFRAPIPVARDSQELRIRVIGFRSVAEEERFEQAFFGGDSRLRGFRIDRVENRAVTYAGTFGGDYEGLARELRGSQVGPFTVRAVYRQGSLMELDVTAAERERFAEMRVVPPGQRAPEVQRLIEGFFEDTPEGVMSEPRLAEREDNGWLQRANRAPLDATFYGVADARSDNDFYVVEAVQPGQRYEIHWVRLDRTNLRPTVRLYDADRQPVRTHHMNTWLRSVYEVPAGQHRFYVEVADRYGFVGGDTGGYLSFPYLMLVRPLEQ